MPKDETALRKLVARAERGERKKLVIRPGERRSLNGLIGKYGDDYDGMARDLKLNYLQWTSGQLRKRVERMREADEANAGNE